jgi:NADH:ubiquinone oxidoreductase subunit E
MIEGTLIADVIAWISCRQRWILFWATRTDDFFARTGSQVRKAPEASYPAGRQRSAWIPMLLYAQDEVGSVTTN